MATSTVQIEGSILPEFVGNLLGAVNSASRVILKTTEGVERLTDGVDALATTALSIQNKKLTAKLEAL